MLWQGAHPIAPGAQKVDFVADETYEVTPSRAGFAGHPQQVASAGYAPWAVHSPRAYSEGLRSFGLKEVTNFMEYDLVYLRATWLSWGARN